MRIAVIGAGGVGGAFGAALAKEAIPIFSPETHATCFMGVTR